MAQHNDLLYNAALSAIIAASTAGSTPIAGTFPGLVANAQAVAAAIDTGIANDGTISQGSGVPIIGANTTAAEAAFQFSKTAIMFGIVFAAFQGKLVTDVVPADLVAGVISLYGVAITGIAST